MILVMRATSSLMMAGVLGDLGGVARLLAQRARPPADDVERRAQLVRDLRRHLADGRQLLGVAQPFLQRQARARTARSPSSRASRSDPVIALNRPAIVPISSSRFGEDDARQVALGDRVDALDQPAQRLHDRLAQREPDAPARRRRRRDRNTRHDAARGGARPRRRCSRCRGACPASATGCAPG
jgi:hypothetical protein